MIFLTGAIGCDALAVDMLAWDMYVSWSDVMESGESVTLFTNNEYHSDTSEIRKD